MNRILNANMYPSYPYPQDVNEKGDGVEEMEVDEKEEEPEIDFRIRCILKALGKTFPDLNTSGAQSQSHNSSNLNLDDTRDASSGPDVSMRDVGNDQPAPGPSTPSGPTTPPPTRRNSPNLQLSPQKRRQKEMQSACTDYELFLLDQQRAEELGVEMYLPKMRNVNKKHCWFNWYTF